MLVLMGVTNKMVASVTQRLLVAAGPKFSDLISLQHWLLRFGEASAEIWQIFGEFGD